MSYLVKEAPDITTVGPTLAGLWSRNLNMQGDPLDKYHWFYRNNPLGPATAFLLEQSNDLEAERVVGCCGVGTRVFYVDGRPVHAGLLADFVVDKEHRTLMPALMLQRALAEFVGKAFPIGYGFPNQAAVGVLERVGFPQLGRMARLVKVLHYGHFVRRWLPGPLASPAGIVLDVGMAVRDALAAGSAEPRYQFEWTNDVDARFDQLWARVQPQFRVIGERSAEFLRWRFVRRLGLQYYIGTLVEPGSRALVGYAIVTEKEPGMMLIADFLAESDAHLGALLRHLASALRQRQMHSAVTFFLGAPKVRAVLTGAGFVVREEKKFVVAGAGRSLPVDNSVFATPEEWYLTEADRDN